DGFRDQLRVELGLVNFLNVDEDLALGALGHILFELFDFGALAADDDAGPRRADGDPQLVAGPVDFDRAHARRLQALAQRLTQFEIFLQQLGVALLGEPAGAPRLVEAQSKTVWMNLLSHLRFLFRHFDDDVRQTALIAIGAAHGGRPDALHTRAIVNVGFGDDQLVHVDIFKPVLHVGDRRLQYFFHGRGDALIGGAQRIDGGAGFLAPDQVDDQPRFLRGDPDVTCFRFRFHI